MTRLTVALATYNRCPKPAGSSDNPLRWCLSSLAAAGAEDLVVVDDGSTDHTPTSLADFAAGFTGRLLVERFDTHRGVSAARNAALRLAIGDAVLLLDDDCVVGPGFPAAAATAYAAARAADPAVRAVTLPYYNRSRSARATVPPGEFGRLDLDDGYFTTNFDCLPVGHRPGAALPPLATQMVSGVCVFDRDTVNRIGGYRDLSGWRSAYSDHLELSADLAAAGWRVRHATDPDLAAIHLKYGAAGAYESAPAADLAWIVPGVGRPLGELVELAARPRVDTGGRMPADAALEEMVGLFFACYAPRSRSGGRRWAVRVYGDYVRAGRSYTAAYRSAEPLERRRERWRRGLARGRARAVAGADPGTRRQVDQQLAEAYADVGMEVDEPKPDHEMDGDVTSSRSGREEAEGVCRPSPS